MDPLILSSYQAMPLLARKGRSSARSSHDLNLTKTEVVLDDEGVRFPQGLVPWPVIEKIAEQDRKVFIVKDSEATAIQVFSETTGWARTLCPTDSAPTVLVSGIPMHRIKGTDPIRDTEAKMQALGTVRGRVLDTATGLGYTAIAAARLAKEVVTIELDPAALELARLNPWSKELFERTNIHQIVGDALEVVPSLAGGSFAAVIHDPPTMSLGGELYSEDFYRELHRVLARGGKLFHYICDPSSGIGKRLWPGVMKRLGRAGFHRIERHPEAFGVTAVS